MEIHELNNFIGTLGANDYFATDNGTDTSKVSAQDMFAPLNARIDNIIAGGDAPSEAEVIDARLGADGILYASLGDSIRGQYDSLYNTTDGYYIAKPLGSIGTYYFNPTAGSLSNDSTRLTYMGGIALRGAKAIDVEVASGNQWNVYFAYVNGSYTYISTYDSQWLTGTIRLIPVPEGANYVYIACKKANGNSYVQSEFLDIFNVRLVSPAEKEIVVFNEDTDFYSDYYGHYQYANASPSVNMWNRLTEERFYEIADLSLLRIGAKNGYRCVVNFFDSSFARLGNNNFWITSDVYIDIPALFPTAKYFKITYSKTDNANMNSSDYNKFVVPKSVIKSIAPAFNKTELNHIESMSFDTSDIAVYGETVVLADTGHLFINGVDVEAEVGHGNNIMFGTELYGDYPKLYAGGWYNWNKCIFVNSITDSSATLIDTITFNDLPTGFVNACVDEPNERVYVFEELGEDTYQGNILFAVCDFDGNVISSKPLGISLPIIQGMDFKDGFCFVTSGDGTAQYPNYLHVFDTSGNICSVANVDVVGELEGISITGDSVYIKTLKNIFKANF